MTMGKFLGVINKVMFARFKGVERLSDTPRKYFTVRIRKKRLDRVRLLMACWEGLLDDYSVCECRSRDRGV